MHGNWDDTRFFPAPLKCSSKNEFEIRPYFSTFTLSELFIRIVLRPGLMQKFHLLFNFTHPLS